MAESIAAATDHVGSGPLRPVCRILSPSLVHGGNVYTSVVNWEQDHLMNHLQKFASAVPEKDRIFHYTSQAGLLGIVQSKSLWASSIRHLNDSAEFSYSVELLRENLNRRLRAEHGPWNDYYGAILENLDIVRGQILFVASFSEDGDLLSQWRAYTPNGLGFSVGFRHTDLVRMAKNQGFGLVKCIYDRADQDALLGEVVDYVADARSGVGHEAAAEHFLREFYVTAAALKHPSFSEEHEWRLISRLVDPDNTETKFRPGKSMLIPYGEIKLADENEKIPVAEIIVGPTPHTDESVASLRYLVISNGLPGCRVVASPTPYRAW
jgi:hypothetical protein